MLKKLIIAAFLAPMAWGSYAHAQTPKLQIVGFEDSLTFRSGDRFIQLTEGSLGFAIPKGSKTTILTGKAYLVMEGATIQADSGDSFSFLLEDGQAQILVIDGELQVTPPGQASVTIKPGQYYPVSEALPTEPAPPADHPLTAIGDAFHKAARLRPKKLEFVIDLHPFYALEESYDSNIYRVPEDPPDGATIGGGVLGSFITKNTFGAKVDVPIKPRHKLEAVYNVNLIAYSQQSSVNNTLDQHVRALYRYNRRKGVVIQLRNEYTNSEDPAFSELVARKRNYSNKMQLTLEWRRSRLFVYGLDAKNTHYKYLDTTLAALLNRYEASFGGYAGIKLRPRTDLRVSYHRDIIHYSAGRTNHSKSHRIAVKLTGRLTPKLTGQIGAGPQYKRFDIPTAGKSRNQTTLLTEVGLTFTPNSRNKLSLRVFRNIQDTAFANNRFYVSTGLDISASRTIRKWTLSANGTFETARYPDEETVGAQTALRRDDTYTGTVRADYKARKWLSAGIKYQRLQRHSTFTEFFDYKANVTSLTLRVTF